MRRIFRLALPSLAIFCVAMLVRLGALVVTKTYLAPERSEVVNVARSLAQNGGLANAYSPDSGPTAHVSPIYPMLLSLLFRLFGTGKAGEIAQESFACCLSSLQWALLPVASRAFGLGSRVGTVTGFLGSVLLLNRWSETKGSFETALAGLAMVVLFSAYAYTWNQKRASTTCALALGLLSGLAVLASASLGAAAAALLLLCCFQLSRDDRGRAVRFAIVTGITMFLVLLPWGIRNYYALGSLVLTRSCFGLELQISNNDVATPRDAENLPSMRLYHPHEGGAPLALLKNLGEINFDRQNRREAVEWIRSHPSRFTTLTLQHIRYFWFPEFKRVSQTVAFRILTLMAVLGGFGMYHRNRFLLVALVFVSLTYSLIYYIAGANVRYSYPISWIFYFLAAAFIVGLGDRLAGRSKDIETERPVMAAQS